MVLGIVIWATGQFASYAVFGHRRPLNAVIMTGIVLLANMSMTFKDELPYLVLFTGGVAVPADPDARVRRARDVAPAPDRRPEHDLVALPARRDGVHPGGDARLARAHARAASNPLAGAWGPVHDQLIEVGESLSKYLPVGGDANGNGVTFGSSAKIAGKWFTDDGIAFTATLPTTEKTAQPVLAGGHLRYLRRTRSGSRRAPTRSTFPPAATCSPAAPSHPIPRSPGPSRSPSARATSAATRSSRPARPTTVDHDATMRAQRQLRLVRHGGGAASAPGVHGDRPRCWSCNEPKKISKNLIEAVPQIYPAEITRALHRRPGGCARSRRGGAARPGQGQRQDAVRARQRDRQGPGQPGRVHLRHQRHRPDLRQREPGRVLRALQARLLPPLRIDDGDADASRVPRRTRSRRGWSRGSCPASGSATSRPSRTAARTPGWRSTSRATAGSRSIRPVPASEPREPDPDRSRRCRPLAAPPSFDIGDRARRTSRPRGAGRAATS